MIIKKCIRCGKDFSYKEKLTSFTPVYKTITCDKCGARYTHGYIFRYALAFLIIAPLTLSIVRPGGIFSSWIHILYLVIYYILLFLISPMLMNFKPESNEKNGGTKGKKIILNVILIFTFAWMQYLLAWLINYENPNIIKNEIETYLNEKYGTDFIVKEPERHGRSWYIYADPINQKSDTLVVWEKYMTPHITFDSYTNDRWRLQLLPDTEKYFRTLYGDDTQIFLLFQCMDEQFLDSAEAKSIDYKDVINLKKKDNYLEIQCYVFTHENPERDLIKQDAEKAIVDYLDQIANEWQFDVFYLSETYKEKFIEEYAKDFNFLRLKDSYEYKIMNKEGIILDWLILMRTKDEPLMDINNGFFFPSSS